jgi:serine/threonine protein kinase
LAKHLTSTSHLTETGAFVGTYQYAAPEQFMGDELDARADVYALGCVIFHALAGRPPFERDTVEALVGAHLFVDPPQLSECCSGTPTALDDVLSRALAKDPHGRYGSAGELVTAAHRTMGRGSDVARVKRSASPVRDAPTAAKAPGADAQPAPPRRPDRSPGPHGTSDRRSLNHTVLRAGALLAAIAAVATLLAVLRSGYTPAGNTVPPADVSRLTALPGTADVRALEGKQFPHDPACSFEPQAKPYQNSAPQEGLIRSVCANDRLGAGYVDIEDQGSAPHRPPACGKVHKVDGTRPYECSAHNGRIFAGADGSSIRVARLRFNDVVALLRDGH